MKKLKSYPFAKYTTTVLFILSILIFSSCGRKSDTVNPQHKNITETVFASGVLVPENQYNLTAQNDGYLIQLNFVEGDIVREGDLLAIIDNKTYDINSQSADLLLHIAKSNTSTSAPALKQIEANLIAAEKKMQQDKQQMERYAKLLESESVSQLEFENIQLTYENSKANYQALKENYKLQKQMAEQQLISQQSQSGVNKVMKSNNELRAIVGGKVYTKYKELGDFVRRGEVIASIGDATHLYAKLSIDESSMSKIKENQRTVIQLNTHKNQNMEATITEIYPSFDKLSQSFYCRADFRDSLQFLISGTQIQANIVVDEKENAMVIPRSYLNYGNTVNVKGKGIVVVETGIVSTEWVEIIKGLDENSTLVLDIKK